MQRTERCLRNQDINADAKASAFFVLTLEKLSFITLIRIREIKQLVGEGVENEEVKS